jgi:hypothetical protein
LLRPKTYAALAGVGDSSKEWQKWTGRAFHLRRRLTREEQLLIGEAIDYRGTEEGLKRFEATKGLLPATAVEMALQELMETAK